MNQRVALTPSFVSGNMKETRNRGNGEISNRHDFPTLLNHNHLKFAQMNIEICPNTVKCENAVKT